jgi:hypothetical protein
MAKAVGAVAGTQLFIAPAGTVVASPDLYVEIKQVANLGDIGISFSKIVVECVGDGYTRQIKGPQSAPSFPLTLNRLDDDPGQVAVLAAIANRNSFYPFKVIDNDGTVITFLGRVFEFVRKYGAVATVKQIMASVEIEPDSIVVT